MAVSKSQLKDIGERSIIQMIRKQYHYTWPDDDCAIIDNGSKYLLFTTDSISQKEHIPTGAAPSKVGYFFAAINLSDIAAMGGTPEYFLSALTLPKSMKISYLMGIESGINACLNKYNVKLVGGDVKQGLELNLAGTAIGSVEKSKIMKRNTLKPNDIVCITGNLGKNAAAYYLWKKTGSRKWAELLLEIEPRIKEGLLAAEFGASAAIDLSDGLSSALLQLNKLTGHGFVIEYSKVPISNIAKSTSIKLKISIEDIAFNFGGEYELLFTISEKRFAKLHAASLKKGIKITAIGTVSGKRCMLIKNGRKIEMKSRGYEHFSR